MTCHRDATNGARACANTATLFFTAIGTPVLIPCDWTGSERHSLSRTQPIKLWEKVLVRYFKSSVSSPAVEFAHVGFKIRSRVRRFDFRSTFKTEMNLRFTFARPRSVPRLMSHDPIFYVWILLGGVAWSSLHLSILPLRVLVTFWTEAPFVPDPEGRTTVTQFERQWRVLLQGAVLQGGSLSSQPWTRLFLCCWRHQENQDPKLASNISRHFAEVLNKPWI